MTHVKAGGDQRYRPDLDGLRAIAISSVVVYHLGLPGVSGGFVGVDIFFVISGFLIVGIIHREISAGSFTFAKFYARRARRILPALIGVLLFSLIVSPFLLTPREESDLAQSAIATLFGISNVKFWITTKYFGDDARYNPLLMTWSLGVEEQFYAFFPLLILMIQKAARQWLIPALVAVAITSFAWSILALGWAKPFSFYMIPARAWELAIGAILAILDADAPAFVRFRSAAKELLGLAGLALVVFAVVGFNGSIVFPGYAAIVPALGAALLIAAEGSVVNRTVLSWGPVVKIGLLSYSWYLWHWPLLSFATIVNGDPLPLLPALAVGALSLICGAASLKFIEAPFRKRVNGAGPILKRYATAIVLAVLPFVVLIGTNGLAKVFSPQLGTLQAEVASGKHNPCLANYGNTAPNRSPRCEPDPGVKPVEVLIGDSHASALAPGVLAVAEKSGHAFWEMTKSSCPQMLGFTRYMASHPGHDGQCAKYNEAVVQQIIADPRIDTVVLTSYWGAPLGGGEGEHYAPSPGNRTTAANGSAALEQGLTTLIDRLKAAKKRIVLVQDAPQFAFDPVRRAECRFIPLRETYLTRLHGLTAADFSSAPLAAMVPDPSLAVVSRVASREALPVIDPRWSVCDGISCRFWDTDGLLYIDSQHLSPSGAKLVLASILH